MQKKNKVLILILFAIFFTGNLFSDGGKWKPVLNKKGIKVYTRAVEGSSMDEFKGIAVINAPIEVVANVLRDADNQLKWMGDCLKSKTIKKFNENHIIVYNLLNIPWPLSDRDLLIDTHFIENFKDGKFLVKMNVYKKNIVPIKKKYVRIKKFQATCSLKKIDNNRTSIVYINKTDPATPVPKVMANMLAKKNPYNTITGMRRMVKLKKYQIPKP